jgi:hypothetical protein
MSKTIRASVLVLLLTCSARADWMQNGSPAPPPSQPANAMQEPTDAVQDPAANGVMGNDAPDSLTQIALELLAVLPSLL